MLYQQNVAVLELKYTKLVMFVPPKDEKQKIVISARIPYPLYEKCIKYPITEC